MVAWEPIEKIPTRAASPKFYPFGLCPIAEPDEPCEPETEELGALVVDTVVGLVVSFVEVVEVGTAPMLWEFAELDRFIIPWLEAVCATPA